MSRSYRSYDLSGSTITRRLNSKEGVSTSYIPRSSYTRPNPVTSRSIDSTLSSVATSSKYTLDEKKEKDQVVEDDSSYSDLRSKLRTLQRQVNQQSEKLSETTKQNEEITVALAHAKRDKAKALAEAEMLESERDQLERENRRIKNKLQAAETELRNLEEERRKLIEKLKFVEVMKRSTIEDDRESKHILSRLQTTMNDLKQQNTQLEQQLKETQDQLRRSRLAINLNIPNSARSNYSQENTNNHTSRTQGSHDSSYEDENTPRRHSRTSSAEVPRLGLLAGYKSETVDILEHIPGDTSSSFDSSSVSAQASDYENSRLNSPIPRSRLFGASELTPRSSSSPRTMPLSPSTRNSDALRIEHLKIEIESNRKELNRLQKTNADLLKRLRDADKSLAEVKSLVLEQEQLEDRHKEAKKSYQERIDAAEERKKQLLAENAALKQKEQETRQAVDESQRQLQYVRQEASALKNQLEKAESNLKKEIESRKKLVEQVSNLEKELAAKENEKHQLNKTLSKTSNDVQSSKSDLETLTSKNAKLEREILQLSTAMEKANLELQDKQAQIDIAQHEARSHLDKISSLQESLRKAEDAQKKEQKERKAAEDELAALKIKFLEAEYSKEAALSEVERRKVDFELHGTQIAHLKANVESLTNSIQSLKQSEEAIKTEASETKHKLEKANMQIQTNQLIIEGLEKKLEESKKQAQQIAEQPESTPTSSTDQEAREAKIKELDSLLASSTKEKQEAEAKLASLDAEKNKLWNDHKRLQMELNMTKSDLQEATGKLQQTTKEVQVYAQKLKQSETDSNKLSEKQEQVLDELRREVGNMKKELKIKDEKLAQKDANQQAQSSVLQYQQELEQLKKQLHDMQLQLNQSNETIETLNNQIKSQQEQQQQAVEPQKPVSEPSSNSQTPRSGKNTPRAQLTEVESLRRDLALANEQASQNMQLVEKSRAELEKIRSENKKQLGAAESLRKTLSKACENWQHQAEAYRIQVDTVRTEAEKNPQLKKMLEAILAPEKRSNVTSNQPTDPKVLSIIKIQALWRGALSRKRNKHWRYRYLKVKEIVDTEETYLKMLDMAHAYFLHPLQTMVKINDAVITQEDISLLFSSLEAIRKNNKEILAMLKARLNAWHVEQLVGDIWGDILSKNLLSPHVEFIKSYGRSTETRVRLTKENPAFSQLLAVIRMLPPMEGKSLEDLLINPIQRIPRYILLLNDLLNHTSVHHPDHLNLQLACSGLQKLASYINENNRHAETMTDMASRLVGFDTLPENPNRKLMHEGRLTQINLNKNEKTPRYVFLFNDYIVFAKENKDKKSKGKSSVRGNDLKVTSKLIAVMKIHNITVNEVGTKELHGTTYTSLFSISAGENPNMFIASNEADMKLWLMKLRDAIDAKSAPVSTSNTPPMPSLHSRSSTPEFSRAREDIPRVEVSKEGSKDKSKRLSAGSVSSGTVTPLNFRSISPTRSVSSQSLESNSSSSTIPLEGATKLDLSDLSLAASTSSQLKSPSTGDISPASVSSDSLETGSTSKRQRTTLSKRHKAKAAGEL